MSCLQSTLVWHWEGAHMHMRMVCVFCSPLLSENCLPKNSLHFFKKIKKFEIRLIFIFLFFLFVCLRSER